MNRILIVEDEITISRLIAVSLRRAGYDCTVANDGSTAADLIAEHDFDLALRFKYGRFGHSRLAFRNRVLLVGDQVTCRRIDDDGLLRFLELPSEKTVWQ